MNVSANITMIEAATAETISNVFVNNNCAAVTLQITGSYTSATVLVEGLVNLNSNAWVSLGAIELGDFELNSDGLSEKSLYQIGIEGIPRVRIHVTAVSGGDITVVCQFGNAVIDPSADVTPANLTPITAYDMAVAGGYTGTKAQFETDMGNSATNATNAAASASAAAASATTASNAAANFAPAYSSSATYAVGDHVLYNGGYYVCNTAITTAEAWTAAHWTAVKVGPEITDLKTQLNDVEDEVDTKASIGQLESEEASRLNADNILESNKIPFPVNPLSKYGEAGQILRSEGNGATQWVDIGTPTPEQVETVVNNWMDEHSGSYVIPDGSIAEQKFTDTLKEKTIKDYVTPQMYGYSESADDVGYYINQALLENDSIFIPDGIYKISTTIYLVGENTIIYDQKHHQTKGKTIVFGPHAIFDVRENIKVFDLIGNANTIIGGLIDLTTVGANYNNAVIYLHSESSDTPCFATKIKDTFISNANNSANGTGIELHVENSGYIYSSEIDGAKLQKLEYGVKFSGSSTNGMNSNMFINISYWSCTQCAIITGGGNTFSGVGQCGTYRNANDESACFYVGGNNNSIDVFVYDVGNTGLIKYIYELSANANHNMLRYSGQQAYKGNNKNNCFYGIDSNIDTLVLARQASNTINDYSKTSGTNKFGIKNFDGVFDNNNFLNTEFVQSIECTQSGSIGVTNLGIALDNETLLRTLSKTSSVKNAGIKLLPAEAGQYAVTLKYNFSFAGISADNGTIDLLALKTSTLYHALAKNISTITAKQIMNDDSEFFMDDITPVSGSQTSIYRVFKTPNSNISITKKVKSLIINIVVNATGANNASILSINKIYATFVSDNKMGDSYNGIVNRSGDDIFGDLSFATGTGIILRSGYGYKFRLKVDSNGNLSTEAVT